MLHAGRDECLRSESGSGRSCAITESMATQTLANGADVRFIQAMLGHADIKTTQVYTRASIPALKDIHSATHPVRLGAVIERRIADGG